MNLRFYAPVIFVKDIGVSKKFYTDVLSQEIEHDFGANIIFKSHLSLWQIHPDHEIARIAVSPRNGASSELYFETEDITGIADLIKLSGAHFLHELKTELWGQQTFRFFDPDHHLIEIGESMNSFVFRIYNNTGSVEETSRITGIAAAVIRTIVN